ncbi:MAG: preprotein translocase subunit Sec61beta [Candidatus Methanofastidiosa archaeon]|jgi:preprotein translocase subunit Sec61beta|nr:preprotein translocase subunit Sec61beta [Candidatus Methanofastidiosa archaeon]HOM95377.1 preprotein translocase subunit Sec61beta [Methanofastidiosum sp.]HPC80828.1 preprotein translocase subunit Sec61beta [Methanofastidiosum sp.]HRS25036.1 preprotein translocase subunit Sec61beta [Methanofastidiosum sp.]
MVKRKPQAVGGAMPATGAGLIRYFDEDEGGLKIRPEVVVGICVIVIVAGILLQIFGAELLGF